MTRAIVVSFGGLAAVFGLLLVQLPTAAAQNVDLQSLIDRLDRIDRDLAGLQRYIYREGEAGGAPPPASGDAAPSPSQQLRIGQLEDELRALTGQVEQTQYQMRQLESKITGLMAGIDTRLAAIEDQMADRRSNLAVVTPPTQPTAAAAPPAQEAVDDGQIVGVIPDPNAEVYDTMGSLGVVTPGETEDTTSMAAVTPIEDPAPAVPQADPAEVYNVAYQLLRQADYAQAELALQDFIDTYPEHPLSGNAYYWLGETFYVRNDYERAAVSFARGYKTFPEGSKASANLLKLGMSLFGMNESAKACATYDRLRADYPDAPASILDRATQESRRAGCG